MKAFYLNKTKQCTFSTNIAFDNFIILFTEGKAYLAPPTAGLFTRSKLIQVKNNKQKLTHRATNTTHMLKKYITGIALVYILLVFTIALVHIKLEHAGIIDHSV